MKQLLLNIEENRFKLFLQFLQTLDYVTVVQPAPTKAKEGLHPADLIFPTSQENWNGKETLSFNNAY